MFLFWICSYQEKPINKSNVVSRQYAPPFATLASVQNAGGAYARDAMIFLVITPSLPVPVNHDLIVGGRWGPSGRRRDAADATGRLTSFRGKEAGRFREVAGLSIVDAGGSRSQ